MKANRYRVYLSFETIARDKYEAHDNVSEVLHDIAKLAGVDLTFEGLERLE